MRKLIPWTDESRPPDWCLPMMEDDRASWWEFMLLGVCIVAPTAGILWWLS